MVYICFLVIGSPARDYIWNSSFFLFTPLVHSLPFYRRIVTFGVVAYGGVLRESQCLMRWGESLTRFGLMNQERAGCAKAGPLGGG
jgi:hypothetical protein